MNAVQPSRSIDHGNCPRGGTEKQIREFLLRYAVRARAVLAAMMLLAIGGAESSGAMVADTMQQVADDVQGVVLAGSGHWVAEQASKELLAALTTFLAPYRDGPAGSTSTSST